MSPPNHQDSHHPDTITIAGIVTDIFAHRFVVETAKGKVLADLGKHNHPHVALKPGDSVVATGHRKPSELKIHDLTVNGVPVTLRAKPDDKKPPRIFEERDLDSEAVSRTAADQGVTVIGQRRKPQHCEILGMNAHNELVELHVELDGTLRSSKHVDPADEKWADEIAAA